MKGPNSFTVYTNILSEKISQRHKIIFLGNGHKYKDKYRQTPPPQTLTELKVENDPEDLNLNSLGIITKHLPKTSHIDITLFLNKRTNS